MKHKICIIRTTHSISPTGIGEDDVLQAYASGRHFLSKKEFNKKFYPVGALKTTSNQELDNLSNQSKSIKRTDRSVAMAAFTAEKLLENINISNTDLKKLCISIGSSRGATSLWEDYHKNFLEHPDNKTPVNTSPLTTLAHISTEVASHINSHGLNIDNSTTCSSSIQSLINGYAWLQAGFAEHVIAGGAEAPLTPFTLAQVEALKIYTQQIDAPYPCMPLNNELIKKNTFVLGEAAALVLMQAVENGHLNKIKNATIIESVGFAFKKPPSYTGIDNEGTVLYNAMKMALKNQLSKEPIDLILMHAPGTINGDEAEMNALKKLFGSTMPNLFSNKWVVGHTYAASAALNIELACLCLKHNIFLDFPYDSIVKNKNKKINKVMINATGFGGNAASIIISKNPFS